MDFLPEHINAYAEQHTRPESRLLEALNRETHAKVIMPRMLSGHLQGQILSMMSRMIRPSRILEIGTYTGYSAICLAEGLTEDGILYTLDINEELADRVNDYIARSLHARQIRYLCGDAAALIPTLDETWDLVFIDADKFNYAVYYDMVIGKVRKGGFIIADNVLWSGKVTVDPENMDKETLCIHAFNEKVHNDERVMNVLFPVRDGLMVLQKL